MIMKDELYNSFRFSLLIPLRIAGSHLYLDNFVNQLYVSR
jgi:hypothetical protein